MIVSVPLHLDRLPGRVGIADLHAALAAHYAGSDRIAVADPCAKLVPMRWRAPTGWNCACMAVTMHARPC